MQALTTHLSGLAVAVVLRVARYSSAFSSFASALAVLRFFSAGGRREYLRHVRRVCRVSVRLRA